MKLWFLDYDVDVSRLKHMSYAITYELRDVILNVSWEEAVHFEFIQTSKERCIGLISSRGAHYHRTHENFNQTRQDCYL